MIIDTKQLKEITLLTRNHFQFPQIFILQILLPLDLSNGLNYTAQFRALAQQSEDLIQILPIRVGKVLAKRFPTFQSFTTPHQYFGKVQTRNRLETRHNQEFIFHPISN